MKIINPIDSCLYCPPQISARRDLSSEEFSRQNSANDPNYTTEPGYRSNRVNPPALDEQALRAQLSNIRNGAAQTIDRTGPYIANQHYLTREAIQQTFGIDLYA